MTKVIKLIKPGAKKQLICFHFAGSNAEYFTSWRKYFDKDIALYAVQLPGRGQRLKEPFVTCLHENAKNICHALQSLPERPTYFFGHSMGATIAFETALRWQKKGNPLAHLIVSSRIAPQIKNRTNYHLQNEEQFIQQVIGLAGTSQRIFDTPELKTLFLPIIRADFKTIETYKRRCKQILSCPISALLGTSDNYVSQTDMHQWEFATDKHFSYYEFEGDHFYINHHYLHFFELLKKIIFSTE